MREPPSEILVQNENHNSILGLAKASSSICFKAVTISLHYNYQTASGNLTSLSAIFPATCCMEKIKAAPKKITRKKSPSLPPLADGQVWRVGELHLQVNRVGPMLVQYKLGKPDAIRVPNIVNGKGTIEKYLKKNKAVLIQG